MEPAMEPAMEHTDTFVQGALKRTGTLYEGAKEGMLKRSGTVSEVAQNGLKRTGTILEGAKEGFIQRTGTISEGARQGLQRTGTILEGAREGMLKRSSTISQGAWEGLQRTGTYFGGAKEGVMQRTGSWGEWASTYAKGIYNPDRLIKASFQEIAGVSLPRTYHSISVINGRAYIFGGESEDGQLADNDMHVVILPSSSVLEADYKSIKARPQVREGPVPESRKGHTAVVVENEIYIYGGELAPKSKDEAGRVWVFDTLSNKWTFHDPKPDSPYPEPRSVHTAAASDQPGPRNPTEGTLDYSKQEIDPADTVPEPPSPDSWGTMFIYGGKSFKEDGDNVLNDTWAFDIATRSWFPLPPPPAPARIGAQLILSEGTLYRVGGSSEDGQPPSIDFLRVAELLQVRERGEAFNKVALPSLLSEWTATPLTARFDGPALAEVTLGNGKKLLLSISSGARVVTGIDITPTGNFRMAGADAPEPEEESAPKQVVAVQLQYADIYGDIVESDSEEHAFVQHEGFAFARGTEVEAASLVIWGGKDSSHRPLGTGWMIRVES